MLQTCVSLPFDVLVSVSSGDGSDRVRHFEPCRWPVFVSSRPEVRLYVPPILRNRYTTGTLFAATAAGEITSISSGTCHRSVKHTLGVALLPREPSRTKPSKPEFITALHFCT